MSIAIETKELTKSFNRHTVVDSLNIKVESGSVFGFLGPNGAGKTTTVRLLNGLLKPTGGQAHILGLDIAKDSQRIRLITGVQTDTNLYENLTATQNLSIWGQLYDVPAKKLTQKISDLLEMFDLSGRASEQVGTFSKGMRQKLLVARSLIHDPEVLFLDEPTSGLDPEAAQEVIHYLQLYIQSGERTVFYCSHRLEEVETLCHSIAIISQGQIKASGTINELRSHLWSKICFSIELANPTQQLLAMIRSLPDILDSNYQENKLNLTLKRHEDICGVVKAIVARKGEIMSVIPESHSLKDIYFKILPPNERYTEKAI